MAKIYLGIGSNLDNPVQQVVEALETLKTCLTGFKSAPLYRSEPLGPPNQPDYINTVIEGITSLAPIELLDKCQEIEAAHRRVKTVKWGPRTLDIDILYYDNQTLHNNRLTIPHPQILNRNFVLIPLLDLIPSKIDPLGRELDITRYNAYSIELIGIY